MMVRVWLTAFKTGLMTRFAYGLFFGTGLFFCLVDNASALPWLKVESPHFIVYGNTGLAPSREYVGRLERYHYILRNFFGAPDETGDTPKSEMYFLATQEDFKRVWPDVPKNIGGVFTMCEQGQAAFAVNQGKAMSYGMSLRDMGEDYTQVSIFHEYAHQFMMANSDLRYPEWFVEGFADYFGSTRMSMDRIMVGMSEQRAYSLQSAHLLDYSAILRNEPSLQNKDNIELFYAQSWLLTSYMLATPQRQAQLSAYMSAYNSGRDPVKVFEEITGIAVSNLAKKLDTYSQDIQSPMYEVHGFPEPAVSITPLPASTAKLLLWEASAKVCFRQYDDNTAHLAEVHEEASHFQNDDYAQLAVARIEIVLGDEALARPVLEKYVATHPDNADGFALLGETFFLMTQHDKLAPGETKTTQMAKARKYLSTAYSLDSLNATTLYYLSVSQRDVAGYPNKLAADAALQAHVFAPRLLSFSLEASRLLIATGRLDDARTALIAVANNPHSASRSAWATKIIAAIDAKKSKEEIQDLYETAR